MMLPDMFLQLVLHMGASMTTPTLTSLATVVTGWLFAGKHTLTGVLVAVGGSGPKHHSAYYRLFAAARWSLDACVHRTMWNTDSGASGTLIPEQVEH